MSPESLTSLCHDHDRLDIVALTMVEGFGAATVRAHLARIRSEGQSIDDGLPPWSFRAARQRAMASMAAAAKAGARCITASEAEYPAQLADLEHPPVALWVMGDISVVSRERVSIVGTRVSTPYGERVTRSIAGTFAAVGATVVSGMARGIDARAHTAAMENAGPTAAVLGTGVDVPYPASHRSLHARIRENGVVISEAPPATKAGPGCFPRRNRIIAALSGVTIVVEAGVKSGALNTAEWAEALGRRVAVVPGPIDSPASLGSNLLLRDGAHPIATVDDALTLAGLARAKPKPVTFGSANEQAVWDSLVSPAENFDVLCARTRLPARVCFEVVTALEIRGLVECGITGAMSRR